MSEKFGRLLHPAQDFYSHSNWVELFPLSSGPVAVSDLVDLSGAQHSLARRWFAVDCAEVVRNDILLDADDWSPLPQGWTVKRNGGGRLGPTLIDAQGRVRGRLLVTGEGTGDEECDVQALPVTINGYQVIYEGIDHSTLNKDKPTNGASNIPEATRRLKHKRAKKLAILQTSYEWCRLVREAGLIGDEGLLLALWVRPGRSPHPAGTPCAALGQGLFGVVVTIDRIRILKAGDGDDAAGEIQLAIALYDDPLNFHRSVHASNRTGRMSLRAGDLVPANQLPAPLVLCVSPGEDATLAVHAWDNDNRSEHAYAFDFDFYAQPSSVGILTAEEDDVLPGFQRRLNGDRWAFRRPRSQVSRKQPALPAGV